MAKLPKEVTNLIDVVTDEDHESVKKGSQLKLGMLYLWVYDAKHKSSLPVWDKLPLVVLLGVPHGKYITGINLHYIPYLRRIQFIKSIQKKGGKVKYDDIAKAWKEAKIPQAYVALSIRKYLVSHIKSNIKIFEDDDDQMRIVKNVLPMFEKQNMNTVYRNIEKELAKQRKKSKGKTK
jgi:hypothetical protein